MAWCDVVEPRTLRECRIALGQSQAAFAALLGVSPESYRTWDAVSRLRADRVERLIDRPLGRAADAEQIDR